MWVALGVNMSIFIHLDVIAPPSSTLWKEYVWELKPLFRRLISVTKIFRACFSIKTVKSIKQEKVYMT